VGEGTATQTFTVDGKTIFQKNDKPAAFGDLQAAQQVHVIYRGTASGNLAMYVLIHVPAGAPLPGGGGATHP